MKHCAAKTMRYAAPMTQYKRSAGLWLMRAKEGQKN